MFGLDSSCIIPFLYIVAHEGHFNITIPFDMHALNLRSSYQMVRWTKRNNDTHSVKVFSFVFSLHTYCIKL